MHRVWAGRGEAGAEQCAPGARAGTEACSLNGAWGKRRAPPSPFWRVPPQVKAWAKDHNLGNPASGLWVYAAADEA